MLALGRVATMQRAKQISESIELGALLALAGGFMDVYSYVGRGGVFANAQTGNILLVGVNLSEGDFAMAGHYLFISGELNLLANCLTSFACGMQVESFRKIHGHGIATTMCIGNLRNALQNVDDYIITHKRGFLENCLLYFGVIFTFVFGAVFGNWCIDRLGLHAIAVASILLFIAFAIMFIDRERAKRKKWERVTTDWQDTSLKR